MHSDCSDAESFYEKKKKINAIILTEEYEKSDTNAQINTIDWTCANINSLVFIVIIVFNVILPTIFIDLS